MSSVTKTMKKSRSTTKMKTKIRSRFIKIGIITAGVCIPTVLIFSLSVLNHMPRAPIPQGKPRSFTASQLAQFNGNNPNEPIYLALDGFVYDVTKGREFYRSGGPYHYLAGKDSTTELRIAGGGIIKRKYPVIGVLK